MNRDISFITQSHPSYIESVYHDFVKNPDTIDPELKKFFEGFDFAVQFTQELKGQLNGKSTQTPVTALPEGIDLAKEFAVYQLIRAYRKRGHLLSKTNPIRPRKDRHPHLDLSDFKLSEADLDTVFRASRLLRREPMTLSAILDFLKKTYTSSVGIEYTYINQEEICTWVEKEFEDLMHSELPITKKKRILEKLNQGVIFEKFLHTKFIGQKRFSLEGGESTIAALDAIITEAAEHGVQEVVM
ncbi:MAG TPA: 2-oxoglutarate dehydrogenase E1 component, partial [Chitinophagaceae bacterium]|nr:2-oxoglutarate dehydrogenase E1 component [Chitinophagaceae bacterium]